MLAILLGGLSSCGVLLVSQLLLSHKPKHFNSPFICLWPAPWCFSLLLQQDTNTLCALRNGWDILSLALGGHCLKSNSSPPRGELMLERGGSLKLCMQSWARESPRRAELGLGSHRHRGTVQAAGVSSNTYRAPSCPLGKYLSSGNLAGADRDRLFCWKLRHCL